MGGGQHKASSMDEVRALDRETARLLHQRLVVGGSTRQNRQGFHRYLVRLCLAVRGQWFDHAQAPWQSARALRGAGRAGLDGNRVRGDDITPTQGRLTPHSIVNKTFYLLYSMAYFPAN